jgi:hypothetical protein
MSKYEKLFGFIDCLENPNKKKIRDWVGGKKDKDGVIIMPFPVDDKKLEVDSEIFYSFNQKTALII